MAVQVGIYEKDRDFGVSLLDVVELSEVEAEDFVDRFNASIDLEEQYDRYKFADYVEQEEVA